MQASLPHCTRQRTRKHVARHCRIHAFGGLRFLTLRVGKRIFNYVVEPILCQLGGKGVELRKADGTSYHVRLDGGLSHCDCIGNERHGHCKHCESLLALDKAGRL